MIDNARLASAIKDFLPQQRWFGSKDRKIVEVVIEGSKVLREEWPLMIDVLAESVLDDNTSDRYQVLVGLRPRGEVAVFLEGKAEAVMGEFETDRGPAYAYDALRDPVLALELLRIAAPDLDEFHRVRPVGTEQSNTSLVYDDRLIMKFFRRIPHGYNLDLEVTKGLQKVGFKHVAELVGEWNDLGSDLAMIQEFLVGGAEGWALALTSLRDLLSQGGAAVEAGGDFAAEAERMGEMTAEMHGALLRAFGSRPGNPGQWADAMSEQVHGAGHPLIDIERADALIESLREVDDPGPAMRVHGDYHLGQVMRTDLGWYVMDFEGEPARSIDDRRRVVSPLKDVAGMLRSFDYAASSALFERDEKDIAAARSWEDRNRRHFLEGYVAIAHSIGGLLPEDTASLDTVLRAFEFDKAVYEVSYELSHRPEWVHIPLAAVNRLI